MKMSKPFNIAVLASTKGTDLKAIIDEIKAGTLPVELKVVISNKKDAYALTRARNQGYEAIFIDPKGKTREAFDMEMAEIIEDRKVDLIVLVGYMRILSTLFVKKFKGRIINIHPSLIPAFSGPDFYDANVHEAVLARGCRVTGCTIHYVSEQCDAGSIILQKTVEVDQDDTSETIKEKVQALEKKWYPEVIRQIAEKKA